MEKRLALVVDDSRTARESLKRMLATHNLEIDTLESAHDALEYLKNTTPDVIFLDHMMPDMDGFQTLEAIKRNPDTATIPVMMYTSKGGDLYVSQARALGAMGILPKQVQHAELFVVLNKLGLVKERRSKTSTAPKTLLLEPPEELALSASSEDIVEIASQAAQAVHSHAEPGQPETALAEHGNALVEQIQDVRKVLDELVQVNRSLLPGRLQPLLIVLAMLIPLLWMLNSYNVTRDELGAARQRITSLVTSGRQQATDTDNASAALSRQLEERDNQIRAQASHYYDSIAWAMNLSGSYELNEQPFGDRRLVMLQELLAHLQLLGFQGTVVLAAHLGEFCMSGDDINGYLLSAGDLPVTDCTLIGNPQQALQGIAELQSIAFANFLSSSPLLDAGRIRIELESYQGDQPLVPYPPLQAGISAADWNRVALANNRVEVRLVPEAGP